MTVAARRRCDQRDRGTGVFGMAMGLLFFFGFLVFAVNVTYNLYATSVVTAFALDAARDAAERDGSTSDAEANFQSQVGGSGASLNLVRDGDVVRATLSFETEALLPALSDSRAFGVINRTFEVRIEEQQDP